MASASVFFRQQARIRPLEIAFWLATLLPFVLTPSYLSLASQIAITALFALSLDLILGYAGIVSLGHAAYFGCGAYAAGLLSKHYIGEPLTGLVVAGLAAGLLGTALGVAHVIDVAGMDRSVDPGDDFYAYANGGWMKTTQIPPDRSSFALPAG